MTNFGSSLRNKTSSPFDIVLIMNRLSCEKKKKLPLRPAPSPALKTWSVLNNGCSDCYTIAWVRFAHYCTFLNSSQLWNVTSTSLSIVRNDSLNNYASACRFVKLRFLSSPSVITSCFILRVKLSSKLKVET